MSTNRSPSKMSTRTRVPAFTPSPSPSPGASTSTGTSRTKRTGGKLFLPRCPRIGLVSLDSFMNSTSPNCAETYLSLVSVLCCVITQGPACNTVAGRTSPFESNNCVMPTFFPRIPATFAIALSFPFLPAWLVSYWLVTWRGRPRPRTLRSFTPPDSRGRLSPHDLFVFFPECLDLHVHARGKVELHQRVHRLRSGIENVEQTLVRADLKLLARLLVHVRRTQHRVLVFHRGQWNRPRDLRSGAPRGFDNLTRRLIEDAVVVGLQPYANFFVSYHVSFS